jgi:hypothetical protein
VVALWCTRAELPPPLPETEAETAAAPAAIGIAQPAAEPTPSPSDQAHEIIAMAPLLTEGRLRVVLRGDAKDAWLGGPGTVTEDDGVMVVTRPLSEAGQAEVARAIGASLHLRRADGSSCGRALVSGAVALARLDAGGEIDRDAGPEAAWRAAERSRVIAGDLELEQPCEAARWGSSASMPAPKMARSENVDGDRRTRAIAALQARPEYRELTDGSGREEFAVTMLSTGDESVLAATFLAETCVGQQPVLTGFWRLEPGGGLRLLATRELVTDIMVAADADGDGRMELLIEDDMLGVAVMRRERESDRYRVERNAPVDIHGCRC